jgi:hypothetical protein
MVIWGAAGMERTPGMCFWKAVLLHRGIDMARPGILIPADRKLDAWNEP